MARKSRKQLNNVSTESLSDVSSMDTEQITTAVYARLSIENSGKDDDGSSIENQIFICKDYVSGHPDLKLTKVYQDNGETGTNFDRPGFQKMMEDVRGRKIRCIVVKDLSRFGRNYIETGEYLEKIFPFLGLRFISVTDGYDSSLAADAEGGLMVPLKNMINAAYAKDISRKIKTSFQVRMDKGEFQPGMIPYGYVKSEINKFRYELDPVAAPFVKLIFEWKVEGASYNEICRRLTEKGAASPAERKIELGVWTPDRNHHAGWTIASVYHILKNPTYVGDLVYERFSQSLYEGQESHCTSSEEWKVIHNANEAIISRELFDRVQGIMMKNREEWEAKRAENAEGRNRIVDLFRGKIFCGDCGKRMRLKKGRSQHVKGSGEYDQVSYFCGGYVSSGYRNCSVHTTPLKMVKAAVVEVIRAEIGLALNEEKLVKKLRGTDGEKNLLEDYAADVEHWTRELWKINNNREKLYESVVSGILNQSEYQFAKDQYALKAVEAEKKLKDARERKEQLKAVMTLDNGWFKAMKKAREFTELDADLVNELVNKIRIFEGKRIEVELNYEDEKAAFVDTVQKVAEASENLTVDAGMGGAA